MTRKLYFSSIIKTIILITTLTRHKSSFYLPTNTYSSSLITSLVQFFLHGINYFYFPQPNSAHHSVDIFNGVIIRFLSLLFISSYYYTLVFHPIPNNKLLEKTISQKINSCLKCQRFHYHISRHLCFTLFSRTSPHISSVMCAKINLLSRGKSFLYICNANKPLILK